MEDTTDSQFSDKDQEDIVASLTEDDLRARSEALDKAQTMYEEYAWVATPKVPCPECGGAGSVIGGSLGDFCPTCGGSRVIESPGGHRIQMPPFAALRGAITQYGNALADRALPAGHRAKRGLALPPAGSVPTVEQLDALTDEALSQVKRLEGATPGIVEPKRLAQAKRAKGLVGEGELDEYTDAELDEMEPDK
jgi:hypothetical protein